MNVTRRTDRVRHPEGIGDAKKQIADARLAQRRCHQRREPAAKAGPRRDVVEAVERTRVDQRHDVWVRR